MKNCTCELRNRKWNPNTGRCESCGKRAKSGRSRVKNAQAKTSAPKSTKPPNYYVDATTGSDETGDGSHTNPFRTTIRAAEWHESVLKGIGPALEAHRAGMEEAAKSAQHGSACDKMVLIGGRCNCGAETTAMMEYTNAQAKKKPEPETDPEKLPEVHPDTVLKCNTCGARGPWVASSEATVRWSKAVEVLGDGDEYVMCRKCQGYDIEVARSGEEFEGAQAIEALREELVQIDEDLEKAVGDAPERVRLKLIERDLLKKLSEELFKPRTPEELAELPSLTRESIDAALEKGRKDAEAAAPFLGPGVTGRFVAALKTAREFDVQLEKAAKITKDWPR